MKMPNVIAAAGVGELFPGAPYAAADVALDPNDAQAWLRFNTDGSITNQNGVTVGNWIEPTSFAPGLYEIRAVSASPDTPDGGTMDTWLALTSNRTWFENRTTVGIDSKTFNVELRLGSGAVLATAACTLTAEVTL